MTPAEMRDYLTAAPLPGDGQPIYERDDLFHGIDAPEGEESDYGMAARSLAHAFLVLCEEDATLLAVPNREDDPSGFEAASNDKLWQAFKARWPEGSEWLGGPSGFQFGWAHNAVRHVLGADGVGNPALLTIGTE